MLLLNGLCFWCSLKGHNGTTRNWWMLLQKMNMNALNHQYFFPVVINSRFSLANRFVFLDWCPSTVSWRIHYSKIKLKLGHSCCKLFEINNAERFQKTFSCSLYINFLFVCFLAQGGGICLFFLCYKRSSRLYLIAAHFIAMDFIVYLKCVRFKNAKKGKLYNVYVIVREPFEKEICGLLHPNNRCCI